MEKTRLVGSHWHVVEITRPTAVTPGLLCLDCGKCSDGETELHHHSCQLVQGGDGSDRPLVMGSHRHVAKLVIVLAQGDGTVVSVPSIDSQFSFHCRDCDRQTASVTELLQYACTSVIQSSAE